MKKCLICGAEEADWKRDTCRACGEATWQRFALIQDENGHLVKATDRLDLVAQLLEKEPETVAITSEMNGDVVEVPFGNAKKRGPGRPRKS